LTLCADAGNSSIKIALVDHGRVGRVVTVASGASASAVEAAVRRAAGGRAWSGACAFSSVFPPGRAALRNALWRVSSRDPLEVSHRLALPVRMGVRNPSRVGTDRICAAAGALGARAWGVVVVDVGTAITVDLVADRVFQGGVIMAGPGLSLAALHAHTALLPALDFGAGVFPPGGIDRTGLAMRWGAGLSAAGGISAAVAMLRSRAGRRLPVVVTGGGAARIAPLLPQAFRIRPYLTLIGIDRIATMSKS
jgi:type III pantothenate kinase